MVGIFVVFWTSNIFFLLKKTGFAPLTRHHTEPKINILLTRNLPFDSDVGQWSHNENVKIWSVFLWLSGHPIFIFFIKENWIYALTRHHTELKIILLTRNLPCDSDVKQWSHLLMIPLHCLWAKSNNRTRG